MTKNNSTKNHGVNLNSNTSECINELYQYYNNYFESNNHHVITCFQTKIFSGSLRRIAEMVIDEELQPECSSFWSVFKQSFVLPDVYVNGEKIGALIDTGASSSVMSLKFFYTTTIQSLQLVFKKHIRVLTMANSNEIKTHG